jgi:hypothetical protein
MNSLKDIILEAAYGKESPEYIDFNDAETMKVQFILHGPLDLTLTAKDVEIIESDEGPILNVYLQPISD